jgi:Putative prokaryotic signal transducing protein
LITRADGRRDYIPDCASVGREARRALALVWGYTATMQDIKLVVVKEYGSRVEADLAKCALEDAGIEAMSQADTAGGMREHLAWSGAGFKIMVREEDAAAARELLNTPFKADESSEAEFGDDHPPEP